MVGDTDFEVQQDQEDARRSLTEEPQPSHTAAESLAIAAEDFIADVDQLLVTISGDSWPDVTDPVNDSMGRLQQAIDAERKE